MFHVFNHAKSEGVRLATRTLFTRAQRAASSELVVTNHAGLFGVDWALRHHNPTDHADLKLVCVPFWLDHIHPSHFERHWGQTALGFHVAVRHRLREIHPNYPQDKPVTWRMMRELREHMLNSLELIHRLTITDLREQSALMDNPEAIHILLTELELKLMQADENICTLPRDTQVYNWLRTARRHDIEFLPNRPHTELYTLDPDKITSPIMILGDGLSVVWLKRDFPHHQIIAIVPDINASFPEIPANANVNLQDINRITVNDIMEKDDLAITVKVHGKMVRVPKTNIYNAIGYRPQSELTAKLPDKQKTNRLDIEPNDWVAPRNIPIGSLTQSLMKFFQQTGNLDDCFELQFHHVSDMVGLMQQYFREFYQINLNEAFFDKLRNSLRNLHDPLESNHELAFYVGIFESTQQPSDREVDLFTEAIRKLQSDRIHAEHKGVRHRNIAGPFNRSYSIMSHSNSSRELSDTERKKIQVVAQAFFNPDEAKVQEFDRQKTVVAHPMTDSDRQKVQETLNEAHKSKKTFSVY